MTAPQSFVVLGTDTDAGKSTFAAVWLAAFPDRWEYWKPVETGPSDAAEIRRLVPAAVVHPPAARFADPVAPPLAARREGKRVPSAAELAAAVPAPSAGRGLLVETFGGPLSPLTADELQLELIRRLGLAAVLVTPSAVGAVGRSVAMLDALAGHGVFPRCVVLVGERDEYAEGAVVRHRTGVRVVCLVPPPTRDVDGVAAAAAAQRDRLAECLRPVTPPAPPPDLAAADARFVWHPYTPLRPASPPLPVVAADGEYVELADGRRLIDATSSWWTILHGHRHPPLAAALKAAADRLDHVIFAGVTHPDAVRFAERILKTCPWPGGRVFFSDNGSTAVEAALKMAYQVWCHRGEPGRTRFVGFANAYHGDTFGAMSVGRDRLFFGRFEPLLFDAVKLPLDPGRLDDFLGKNAGTVAAVIVEPLVQAAGGMRMHTPDVLRDLFAAARRHGVLFIADEVMTGNRTGRRWAFDHAGVAPDLICAAKTLAGGLLPLAVTLASPAVVEAFDTADRTKTFFHGHSFTAHPLACAVAAVNEELVSEPGVLGRAADIERLMRAELSPLLDHPAVADVRFCGSAAAVEVRAAGGYLAADAERWKAVAVDAGVLLRPLGNVIYALPPLGTPDDSLRRVAGAIRLAVTAGRGERPP